MQPHAGMPGKVLVTGGAGFIGSHLIDRLAAAGERIVVLDDLSSGDALRLPQGTELIRGCILDPDALDRAMAGVTSVFHLAARVSVQECITHWLDGHAVNLGGTIQVLHAAWRAGNVPVVYASSAAIYGDRQGAICTEESLPQPISPYAADKLGCEQQARAMAAVHGLPSVGLRFFNVYGPRQDAASPYAGVISRFCANRLADRPHDIFGDGHQSRDFIHVGDVADGLVAARTALRRAGGAHVHNLCTGTGTTLLELAATIDRVAGRSASPIRFHPARSGDIRLSRGCPLAARQVLGFAARTDIAAGLADLWGWLNRP